MASIAITIGGALVNAAAFTGFNYLAKYVSGDGNPAAAAAQGEKVRHDKGLEAYQAAYAKYMRDRTKLDCEEPANEGGGQAELHQY